MIAEAAGLLLFPCLFPCLVIGIIMLISLLTCDFIEKFVMERFCSVKNRRRRQRESSSNENSEQRGKPGPRQRLQDNEHFEANAPMIQMPQGPHSSTYSPLPGPSRTLDLDSDQPPPYHECISNNKSKKQ